jgi:crotonobetainyl-CoA:carnitine CoA-transferase CaiB-like acyl-CoA transferase
VLDERAALHQERTQMRELRQEIEAARERVPTRAEAQELERRAGLHLGRMEGWEQIEQQRQAEARQELERRAAERLRDRPAPGEDGPRRSGPRFSGPR